jgi:hypothetical protein
LGPHRVNYRDLEHVLIQAYRGGLAGYPFPDHRRPLVEHLTKLPSTAPAGLLLKMMNDGMDGIKGHR